MNSVELPLNNWMMYCPGLPQKSLLEVVPPLPMPYTLAALLGGE